MLFFLQAASFLFPLFSSPNILACVCSFLNLLLQPGACKNSHPGSKSGHVAAFCEMSSQILHCIPDEAFSRQDLFEEMSRLQYQMWAYVERQKIITQFKASFPAQPPSQLGQLGWQEPRPMQVVIHGYSCVILL